MLLKYMQMMLLYSKLRFCSVLFLLWRSRSLFYELEPTVPTAYGFLEMFSDVVDGALTASPYSFKEIDHFILSTYLRGGIRLYFCAKFLKILKGTAASIKRQ